MLAVPVLVMFLLLNSTPSLDVVGWALALTWAGWRMIVRPGAIALPVDLAQILMLPAFLLLTTLPGALFHIPADSAKDLWYFTNPLVYIAFGFFLFEEIGLWQRFAQPFLIIGVLTSIYSVYNVYTHRGLLLASQSVEQYRQVAGFGFGQAAIPIALMLFTARAGLAYGFFDRSRIFRTLLYVAGSLALILSLSRLIILVPVSAYLLTISPRKLGRTLMANNGLRLILLTVGLGVGGYVFATSSFDVGGFFLEKIANTGSEVQIQHYDTFDEINENWRGFEAYRALRTYDQFSPREKVMGGGLGTFIDLGFAMQLSATEAFQLIPVTHNGYVYLLVKTGVVGLVLFAIFIFQIGRRGWRNLSDPDPVLVFAGLLLVWTALDFAMTQGVITGIYNKAALAPNLVLLGAAYASLRRQRLEHKALAAQTQPEYSSDPVLTVA